MCVCVCVFRQRLLSALLALPLPSLTGHTPILADGNMHGIQLTTLVVCCRVVLAEHLSLKEQVQIVSQSDIVIMNHGAAMGNIMFMAPVRFRYPP